MVEISFGLSRFSLNQKCSKTFGFSSVFIKIAYILLYPISCNTVLGGFLIQDAGITMIARNITFVFNWFLLVSIFMSEIFGEKRKAMSEVNQLFKRLIELQSLKDNFKLLMSCTVKAIVVISVLFYNNYGKHTGKLTRSLTLTEHAMFAILMLPFIVFTLISNRIYIANVVVKHSLEAYTRSSDSRTNSIATEFQMITCDNRRLKNIFAGFNRSNEVNLLVIFAFSALNIVYEVDLSIFY